MKGCISLRYGMYSWGVRYATKRSIPSGMCVLSAINILYQSNNNCWEEHCPSVFHWNAF